MKRTSHQSTSEQHRRLRTDAKIEIELFCIQKLHRELSYTAESNDKLLNFNQMKGRKQRSAIDAVLNLVHDAQMVKS